MTANSIIWLGSVLSGLLLFLSWKSGTKSQNLPSDQVASSLYQTLVKAGCHPSNARLLIAQSAHETNGWTSDIYIKNHNLFGMKMPHVRQTTAVKALNGYAYYNTIEDSAADMLFWLAYEHYDYSQDVMLNLPELEPNRTTFIDQSINMFVTFLKDKGYFTDTISNYYNGVKFWYHKIMRMK